MRSVSRVLAVVAASSVVVSTLINPAVAASDAGSTSGDETACVVDQAASTGLRTSLVPGDSIREDVAFNRADPDAERNPLELLRFPDEAGLWGAAGFISPKSLTVGANASGTAVRLLSSTGVERWDTEISDSVVRLYCGLFDRRPGAFELEYWVGRYRNGLPLVTIAEAFTHSQEFVGRYGAVGDASLVDLLYRDVLGREASVETVALLASSLESGEEHRGHVVVRLTESAEYVTRTRTAPPVKPILPYPDVGSGRRIIYTDSGQRVWLINGTGELAKTHQVTGRRGVPGVGRYRIYSMSRYAWAPYDGITMEYMVRFARGEWP